MIYSYNNNSTIYLVNKNITEEIFIERCGGVKGTFGERFFQRMFKTIFTETLDLNYEYQNYYSKEYSTLKEYLYAKLGMNIEDCDDLVEKLKDESIIALKRCDYLYSNDHSMEYMLHSDLLVNRVSEILLLNY